MPRPALKEERSEQIMLAFEKCVARYGLEGATLEQVAKEAGLARALIRHNVGNRSDLVDALTERFFINSAEQWAAISAALPANNRSLALVEYLFDSKYTDAQLVLITEALIAGATQDQALAKRLREWLDASLNTIQSAIAADCPTAPADQCEAVAAGVLGIYFNVDSFALIGDTSRLRNASKAAAQMLIEGVMTGDRP